MTNEKINATVEEIMEYEALLDEVKGIVDGLKDNLKNEMAERKVESLSTDRYMLSGKLNDVPSGRLFRADFGFLQMCQSL